MRCLLLLCIVYLFSLLGEIIQRLCRIGSFCLIEFTLLFHLFMLLFIVMCFYVVILDYLLVACDFFNELERGVLLDAFAKLYMMC